MFESRVVFHLRMDGVSITLLKPGAIYAVNWLRRYTVQIQCLRKQQNNKKYHLCCLLVKALQGSNPVSEKTKLQTERKKH